jgi:hypothetical protein
LNDTLCQPSFKLLSSKTVISFPSKSEISNFTIEVLSNLKSKLQLVLLGFGKQLMNRLFAGNSAYDRIPKAG